MIYLLEGTVKTESRVIFFVDAISKFDAAQKVRNGKDFLRYQLDTKDESYPTNFTFHGVFEPFDEQALENIKQRHPDKAEGNEDE